jgi:ethanolamine utilization cobalamin adenosyltransferase
MLLSSDVDSDSEVIIMHPGNASNGENKMQNVFEEVSTEEEKCVYSSRFMGELWSVGVTKTNTIHKFIKNLLNNAANLSLACFYALKTVGEELEERNDNPSKYFSMIEDMCKSKNDLSNCKKQNLQDLVQFRRCKWMQLKYHSENDYT